MTPARSLIGYRIDAVERGPHSDYFVVIWGRKWFWQRSRPLMIICTSSGQSSDVYAGDGNGLDFSAVMRR